MVTPWKFKYFIATFALAFASVCVALLVGEFVLRKTLGTGNFLRPFLIHDDILGTKVKPYSAGHDAWGYRNPSVPDSVDIVAIGDSQTYGYAASATNSWPAQLQNMLDKDIYNLSLGGYNPTHYFYLLKEKAIQLKPSLIITGFYFGNDLLGTYRTVYKNDYWKHLRKASFIVNPDTALSVDTVKPPRRKAFRKIRSWLSQHSVLYQALSYTVGNTFRFIEMKYNPSDKHQTIFEDKALNIYTGFTPKKRLLALDLQEPVIREGLRLSLEIINHMKELCHRNNIKFFVVLIPTKERVYSKYIRNNIGLNKSELVDKLIKNEELVSRMVKEFMKNNGISYYDVLEPLQASVDSKTIYPQHTGGHPNKEGYFVIANAVKGFIKQQKYLIAEPAKK